MIGRLCLTVASADKRWGRATSTAPAAAPLSPTRRRSRTTCTASVPARLRCSATSPSSAGSWPSWFWPPRASATTRASASKAFQGLYLFVAWLIVDWVLGPLFSFPRMWGPNIYRVFPALMKAGIFAAWVVMIVKTAQDELYKLPILGDLARKIRFRTKIEQTPVTPLQNRSFSPSGQWGALRRCQVERRVLSPST